VNGNGGKIENSFIMNLPEVTNDTNRKTEEGPVEDYKSGLIT
jgi:hypothetical protein